MDTFNIEMRELTNKLYQLENTNATLKMKYEEEFLKSEALQYKLKETINKLDNLQNLFDQNDACHENLPTSKKQFEKKHGKKTAVILEMLKMSLKI